MRRALALCTLLGLAGCAAPLRAPDQAAAPDPATLVQWTASGRLAIAAGGEGGSGAFTWAQDGSTSRLDLRGPLGAGALRIVATPATLSLEDGAGRALDADAARAHLQAQLGADLPWNELRYWMLGLAAPGVPADVTEADATPWRVIEQSGWRIAYDAFTATGGLSLPHRFTARREDVRVKVIVDAWTPAAGIGGGPEAGP
jgi:outer membrane lipoprotein LolB